MESKIKKGSDTIVRCGNKENNFNIIRLIATIFVFAGHMGVLLGGTAPLFGGCTLHELGVKILFLISGYLITMSWFSDPNPLRYGIRRFFRLWPPFAVMILSMVYIAGPVLSDLGVQGYFESGYKNYLWNLRFFIVYAQPGVFQSVPLSNVTNGSLWTMPVEASLYILTPIILILFRVKYRSRKSFYFISVLTVAAILADLYLRFWGAGLQAVFYGVDLIAAYHLIVFYLIGMLYTYDEAKKHLNLQIGCAGLCLFLLFQHSAAILQHVLLYIVLPYFVFSFVFVKEPVFGGFGRKMELSYGIYLYGFFFQQLVVYLSQRYAISLGYLQAFVLSMLPAVAAALISYYLVERPAQNFVRYLVGRRKKKS